MHSRHACLARSVLLLVLALSTSTFAQGPPNDALAIANSYLQTNRGAFGLTDADIADRIVSDSYRTQHNGVTHVYFLQRLQGIEVFNGILNVNVTSAGRVIAPGSRFVGNLVQRVNTRVPLLPSEAAVLRAAAHLGIRAGGPLRVKQNIGGPDREVVYFGDAISRRDIPVKLMFLPMDNGTVRLTWDLRIEPNQDHTWQMKVDVITGEVLHQLDLVQRDTYKVYAWPAESPNHATPKQPLDGRTVVTNPADATASPFSWHDLDGLLGGDTVNTTGNNVFAQTDLDANDVFTPLVDTQPADANILDGSRDFVFPIDLTQGPEAYMEAAVTNLFYWNNVIHDIMYKYGFDEPAGNFQQNNYGKGGLGTDGVQADAQDGSGTNNANFLTLPDGTPPRMQMFVWQPGIGHKVVVNSPTNLGPYPASGATFGPKLTKTGFTDDAAIANDSVGATGDACETVGPEVSGKIALVDRGTCTFLVKAQNVQAAGATGMIVVNNQGDNNETITMGGDDPNGTVTISSVMIGRDHGAELKQATASTGSNVTMLNEAELIANRDSDLDNGVIIHEYGHGISNRLTGGPSNVFCLSNDQQAGEGWSDWFALVLTARTGDTATMPRTIASYLTYEDDPATARGIRPFRYTTDMSVNPQTYGDLAEGTLSVPHGVGSVWATTTWDMYWALVSGVSELNLLGEGFRQNLYDTKGSLAGNQIALQLVMDGLKMQPCDPSFLDARDAILAADDEKFNGKHFCHIWWAFARRGMGVNALDDDGGLNVVEDFNMPPSCKPATGCTVPPKFAGAAAVISATDGTCSLTVKWNAATPNCGTSTGVTYTVYRSTASNFTPAPSNRIASGLTGTSYTDTQVLSGVRYFYIVRATDSLGNTDSNLVRKSGVPAGQLAAGSFSDNAGDTGTAKFTPQPGTNAWAIRAAGGVGGSKVYATSAAGNYPHRSCLRLESDTIYLGSGLPDPILTFRSRYGIEPAWDGGIVEVSTEAGNFNDWKKLTINYPGAMAGPLGNTACTNPGLRDGELAFNGILNTFGVFTGSLSEYAGDAIRVRFVFGSDAATNDIGWFIDDININNTRQPGSCTTAPLCFEDDASQISYSSGWHKQKDPDASGGSFRLHVGKDPTHGLTLDFTTGGKITLVYHYAKSPKGGKADVYIDGAPRGTIDYKGTSGDTRNPQFGFSEPFVVTGEGPHKFELRNLRDVVYIDKICIENGTSDASPSAAPGETTSNSKSVGPGKEWLQNLTVPAGTKELSVVAESNSDLPIKLVVIDPLGGVVGTSDNSSGFAVVDSKVSLIGIYVVKVINLSVGGVNVWTMSTPLVQK